MRVTTKPLNQYAWFIRPFFWKQQRKYGQVLIPGMVWGRVPRLFAAVALLYGMFDLKRARISPVIRSLVTVRVSQINWCEFCVDINSSTLLKRSGSEEKVQALAEWRSSALFDRQERAVLEYTEAVTHSEQQVTDAMVDNLKQFYDEEGIVELTGLIAFQNLSSKFNSALAVPAQGFCQIPQKKKTDPLA